QGVQQFGKAVSVAIEGNLRPTVRPVLGRWQSRGKRRTVGVGGSHGFIGRLHGYLQTLCRGGLGGRAVWGAANSAWLAKSSGRNDANAGTHRGDGQSRPASNCTHSTHEGS